MAKKEGIDDLAPTTIRKYARRERYGFRLGGRYYISPEKFVKWINLQKKKGGMGCLRGQ